MSSGSGWSADLDALLAAPKHHRLLLENALVRVLDTRIAPGDRTPVHTHQWPAVHSIVSWSAVVRRDADGEVVLDTRTAASPPNPPLVIWGSRLVRIHSKMSDRRPCI